MTEGLLDKKDRRESRGLGGHSTIARGYYKLGNDDLDYVKEREEEVRGCEDEAYFLLVAVSAGLRTIIATQS